MAKSVNGAKIAQNGPKADRAAFWDYCQRTGLSVRQRSAVKGFPCDIDAYFIDRLLVDQRWRCAISKIVLRAPRLPGAYSKDPFAPSIDRIVPRLGYVAGNVRIVCNMVNAAMNEWGLDNFLLLVEAMKLDSPTPPDAVRSAPVTINAARLATRSAAAS